MGEGSKASAFLTPERVATLRILVAFYSLYSGMKTFYGPGGPREPYPTWYMLAMLLGGYLGYRKGRAELKIKAA